VLLSPKELVLLQYLIRSRGKILSRREILEHVWDMNADPFTNTVEAHISKLRKKLECKGKKDIIQTIPGVGYRIE